MKLPLQKLHLIIYPLVYLMNPGLALATQGREDKCMITSIAFFAVPAMITLASFTIYATVKLRKHGQLPPHTGKKMLILSAVALIISVPLPTWCMYLADWFRLMVWSMVIFFTPVLLLSILNIFLAKKLRARAIGPVPLEKKL